MGLARVAVRVVEFPICCDPKFKDDWLKRGAPLVPEPVTKTLWANSEFPADSITATVALRWPDAPGENERAISHVAPAVRLPAQVMPLAGLKSPAFVPEIQMRSDTALEPLLVISKLWMELAEPTGCAPNDRLATLAVGGGPLAAVAEPDTATVPAPAPVLTEFEPIETVPCADPVCWGAKAIPNPQAEPDATMSDDRQSMIPELC